MPDMYDKLGELLNEALESGKIPQNHTAKADDITKDRETSKQNSDKNEEVCDKSGLFSFKTHKNTLKIPQKEKKATGEVIKLHKYATFMQFPPQIQQALHILDIAYPVTLDKIKRQYHKKLKEFHPDTKNAIQNHQNVQNNRQYTIDELISCYNLLSTYFNSL